MRYLHAARHIALVTAITVVAIAHASAGTRPPVPIQINAVSLQPAEVLAGGDNKQDGSLAITFSDSRAVAATRVAFLVCSRAKLLRTVSAKGSFAPGVPVTKTWTDNAPKNVRRAVLESATFSDNTRWTAGRSGCR